MADNINPNESTVSVNSDNQTSKKNYADIKTQWEIRKIRAEMQNLKKPWIENPASWFTILTTLLGLVGIFIQYTNNQASNKLAELNQKEATIKADSATRLFKLMSLKTIREQKKQDTIDANLDALNTIIRNTKTEDRELFKLVNQLKSESPNGIVQATVKSIIAILEKKERNTEKTDDQLNKISTTITNKDAQSFAVIGSYSTLREAKKDAAEKAMLSKQRNIHYRTEIYYKAGAKFGYLLTLGGYLKYEDAKIRTRVAKAKGISLKPYIELSKDMGENLYAKSNN